MAFITEQQAEEALHFLRESAQRLGELTAKLRKAETWTKVVLALEMKKTDGPVSAQEREARTSNVYQVAAFDEAAWAGELAKLRAEIGHAEATLDCWRTQQATERAMRI
jgi:hypothetical protein